jgi:hypothetical protein
MGFVPAAEKIEKVLRILPKDEREMCLTKKL